MQIRLASIIVNDQTNALAFYTETLGFRPAKDIPAGEFRWITLTSPDGPQDIELALEPNENPAAKAFQSALYEQGIPLTAFAVTDIAAEYERLKNIGVSFRVPPTFSEFNTYAVFDDTCGNFIQIYQEPQ